MNKLRAYLKPFLARLWLFPFWVVCVFKPTCQQNLFIKILLFTWQFLLIVFTLLFTLSISLLLLCLVWMVMDNYGLSYVISLKWGFWHPVFHLLFEGLGYLTSYFIYQQVKKTDVLTPEQRKQLKWWTLGGAVLGAKLIPVLENMDSSFLYAALISGKSLAGGLLGGVLGTEIGKWRAKITLLTGDVLVWPLLIGTIVGRLGCSSCAVIDGMLGTTIPANVLKTFPVLNTFAVDTNNDVASVFWVNLLKLNRGVVWNIASLEIMGLLSIMAFLLILTHTHKLYRGQQFYSFCFGYFLLRFGLEIIKYGSMALTVVQYVSLIGLLICLLQWQRTRVQVSY
jgi:prolipoprotein diacylglyceryltransferase